MSFSKLLLSAVNCALVVKFNGWMSGLAAAQNSGTSLSELLIQSRFPGASDCGTVLAIAFVNVASANRAASLEPSIFHNACAIKVRAAISVPKGALFVNAVRSAGTNTRAFVPSADSELTLCQSPPGKNAGLAMRD